MTAENVFARFPAFIREYIYAHGWDELRQTQLDAARVIFDSDDNLLLASSTASGKTEAVFFPILTELCELPMCSDGIKVLYIAPLKSLINDQFGRMEDLLDQSGIPVFHWHGDVGASSKTKLLKDPEGILQITPESLESMLINRANDIPRLFSALRYVVIDEIHTMIGSDRGNQVICLLTRLARLASCRPRRIGLSATIGDPEAAAAWLSAGCGRKTAAPAPPSQKLRWRLGMEHFFIQNTDYDQVTPYTKPGITKGDAHAIADAGYEYLYDAVKGRKALVFSNSREETELVTATLRQIAKARGEKDRFLIHHGNLSASLREDAEIKMKDEAFDAVTCATVTMELGIDIGKLSRVVQMESPNSVSAFLQRLGRSGRRGDPPEMLMVFREETPLPNAPLPELIPWELLRAIAIVQLYVEKRFIEPPRKRIMPLSLAFHQTLSILASVGELSPRSLAERVLSLPPMQNLDKEIYRALLVSMVQNEYLAMTDEGGLIVGLTGEKIIGSYKFYAVFKDSEDYTVRFEAEEIGTITNPIPKGERFALAGRVWEVEDVDIQRRLIYVHPIEGKMEISWPGDSGEVHTAILRRMREILFEDTVYPYLLPNAKERLDSARHTARATGMAKSPFLAFSDTSGCLFPWLGTRAFRTLKRFLQTRASVLGISNITSFGCYYITFKLSHGEKEQFMSKLISLITKDGIDPLTLIPDSETPITDKYDECIPSELLRRAYATDRLSPEEVMTYFVAECQNERTKS